MSAKNSNHDAACMASFRDRLEECMEWPCAYVFKFIVPAEQAQAIQEVLPAGEVSTRSSRTAKYVSVTAEAHMESPEKVIEVYRKVEHIPGVMSL